MMGVPSKPQERVVLYPRKEKYRRKAGSSWGNGILRKMFGSVATITKITLICLNIWVLAVVLVVSLGHWRVFETVDSTVVYDNSHLIVMRELKDDADNRLPLMSMTVTNISEVESYYVPPEDDPTLNVVVDDTEPDKGGGKGSAGKGKGGGGSKGEKKAAPPVVNPQPPKDKVSSSSKSSGDAMSRVKNLQHWCDQKHIEKTSYDKIPTWKLKSIVYDEKHKLLFCQIPGAALNEWRKIMLITTKIVNTSSPSAIGGGDVFGKYGKSLKKLSDVSSASKRKDILSKFHKVIFVRDPLERLLVAYQSKLKTSYSKKFQTIFGSEIIKKYRKGASDTDIKAGSSVTFSEFIRYIIDVDKSKKALNENWQQYYKQCHPCDVNYDFVGVFENVEADTRTVLQKVGADKKVKPPYIGNRRTLSEKELSASYKSVDVETLKKLKKVFIVDYSLFGYKSPAFFQSLVESSK